jgi:hypothetical protein
MLRDCPRARRMLAPHLLANYYRRMVSNSTTYFIAIFALIVYTFYIIASQGTAGLLMSAAIGLITAAFVDSIEYVAAIVIIIGLIYVLIMRRLACKREGFDGYGESGEGVGEGSGQEISTRVKKLGKNDPYPVVSVGSEGFADVSQPSDESDDSNTEEGATVPADGTAATTADVANNQKPVDIDQKAIVAAASKLAATMAANPLMASSPAAKATPVAQPSQASTAAADVDTTATVANNTKNKTNTTPDDSFQGQKSNGLFKLGEMPSESKSGPFVDVASTLNKAMSALQPEQMAAMTAESKGLLETQQNLMSMLQSMRPVLQDGRQLLDTFGSIFGGMGNLPGVN